MQLREFRKEDVSKMLPIWNEIVEEGNAFPQEETLDEKSGYIFFASQTYTAVAEEKGEIVGLYILHPNNIGRCGHLCNASYAVSSKARGRGIGRMLVTDCLRVAKEKGFLILQFNAVVESNRAARALYESLGFIGLGTIPLGFRKSDGMYEAICPYYKVL